MTAVDIIIGCLAIYGGYIGYRTGFLHTIFSTIGAFVGLSVGVRIGLLLDRTATVHNRSLNQAFILFTSVAVCLVLLFFGRVIAVRLRTKIIPTRLYHVDKYIGIVVAPVAVLFISWLAVILIENNPSAIVTNPLLESRFVAFINRQPFLGKPFADQFYTIIPDHHLITPELTTDTFVGPTSDHVTNAVAPTGPLAPAISASIPSTVSVAWKGCGLEHVGSGFVVAPQIVVTAAHVVAGSGFVTVEDTTGSYQALAILYDPSRDVAALYVPGLTDPALPVDTQPVLTNIQEASLGYPKGGSMQSYAGYIVGYDTLAGLGVIDNQGLGKNAKYYAIGQSIEPGDSGGPVFLSNGQVIGHVTNYSNGGNSLAVAYTSYANELSQSITQLERVPTGSCVNGPI